MKNEMGTSLKKNFWGISIKNRRIISVIIGMIMINIGNRRKKQCRN